MARVGSALFLIVVACGGTTKRPSESTETAELKQTSLAHDERTETKYQTGDFVVYRYSGEYTEHPVVVEEVIDKVEGHRLSIHVTATRGEEKREWVQVVTETPEDGMNGTLEELYEIHSGASVKLDHRSFRDILRLSEWMLAPCGGGPEPPTEEKRTISIAGENFDCSCRSDDHQCDQEPFVMSACECPDFVWTQASAELRHAEGGHVMWNREVVEHGRRKAK